MSKNNQEDDQAGCDGSIQNRLICNFVKGLTYDYLLSEIILKYLKLKKKHGKLGFCYQSWVKRVDNFKYLLLYLVSKWSIRWVERNENYEPKDLEQKTGWSGLSYRGGGGDRYLLMVSSSLVSGIKSRGQQSTKNQEIKTKKKKSYNEQGVEWVIK